MFIHTTAGSFHHSARFSHFYWGAGSPTAKELQKFITSSFPSRVPRLDAASIQAFLAIQPQACASHCLLP